jgi:hypothetical protein
MVQCLLCEELALFCAEIATGAATSGNTST